MNLSRRTLLTASTATALAAGLPTTALAASRRRPDPDAPLAVGIDSSVWRQHSTPLVPPSRRGPLQGETVAVKDLFDVAGQRVGAGNPAYLAESDVKRCDAWAVRTLRAAGASVEGIARTDEFAYSLAGTNGHYGTPPNPAAPDRIPGGSSSGPASAVAMGQASVGLGTDTGGSVRIPSAYQGLYGLRPTHDAISRQGLLPLAQSFDTVGWITRNPETLERVGHVLLPVDRRSPAPQVVVSDELIGVATSEVQDVIAAALDRWTADDTLPSLVATSFDVSVLPSWVASFQTQQGFEAWRDMGPWIEQHWETLNPDVRARFERAATYTAADHARAKRAVDAAWSAIDAALGDSILLLPAASSVAPTRAEASLGGPVIEATRAATFQLTCIAGSSRRCALSVPVRLDSGPPVGLSLVGPRGSDRALLALARRLQQAGVTR